MSLGSLTSTAPSYAGQLSTLSMTEAVPPLSFPPGSGGFNAAGHMGLLGNAGLTPALHPQPFGAGNLPFMYGPPAQMMFHSIPQHVGAHPAKSASASPHDGKRAHSRRLVHNQAEQRRAKRINDRIEELKDFLEEDGFEVKKDKHSVLAAAVSHMADLRARIRHSQSVPRRLPPAGSLPGDGPSSEVDYRSVFLYSSVAQAIATVEGKFMDCNRLFQLLSGYEKSELIRMSFFSLTPKEDLSKTFNIVAEMMDGKSSHVKRFRKYCNMKTGCHPFEVSMALVRDEHGTPKHFACAIIPLGGARKLLESADKAAGIVSEDGAEEEAGGEDGACPFDLCKTDRDPDGESNGTSNASNKRQRVAAAASTQGSQPMTASASAATASAAASASTAPAASRSAFSSVPSLQRPVPKKWQMESPSPHIFRPDSSLSLSGEFPLMFGNEGNDSIPGLGNFSARGDMSIGSLDFPDYDDFQEEPGELVFDGSKTQ